jgi:hypothetical protein
MYLFVSWCLNLKIGVGFGVGSGAGEKERENISGGYMDLGAPEVEERSRYTR